MKLLGKFHTRHSFFIKEGVSESSSKSKSERIKPYAISKGVILLTTQLYANCTRGIHSSLNRIDRDVFVTSVCPLV